MEKMVVLAPADFSLDINVPAFGKGNKLLPLCDTVCKISFEDKDALVCKIKLHTELTPKEGAGGAELQYLQVFRTENQPFLPQFLFVMESVPVTCAALRKMPMRRLTNGSKYCTLIFSPVYSTVQDEFVRAKNSPAEQRKLICDCLRGLQYLQKKYEFMHNDFHHDNILFDEKSRSPVLWDFECSFDNQIVQSNPDRGHPDCTPAVFNPFYDVHFFLWHLYNDPSSFLHPAVRAQIEKLIPHCPEDPHGLLADVPASDDSSHTGDSSGSGSSASSVAEVGDIDFLQHLVDKYKLHSLFPDGVEKHVTDLVHARRGPSMETAVKLGKAIRPYEDYYCSDDDAVDVNFAHMDRRSAEMNARKRRIRLTTFPEPDNETPFLSSARLTEKAVGVYGDRLPTAAAAIALFDA